MTEEPDPDEFIEWLDEQSKERIQIAYGRAQKRDTEWWDDESLERVLMEEVYSMYVGDTLNDLVREGYAEAQVLEDGKLGFSATEKGKEYYDNLSGS